MRLAGAQKEKIIKEFGRHQNDTGSPEVQIALLTTRISELTGHLQDHTHDESSRRGFLKICGNHGSFRIAQEIIELSRVGGKLNPLGFFFSQFDWLARQGNAVVGAVRLSGMGDPTRAVDQFLPEKKNN